MDTELERRLVALELKALDAEDTIERLNDLVVAQQAQLERVIAELQRIARQAAAAEPTPFRSLRDELPPHW